MTTDEEWSDIDGYDNYMVSNYGRVKVKNFHGSGKDRILSQNTVRGYKSVKLSRDGERHAYYVHRLVASAFVNNPGNYQTVNHINEDKSDNRSSNLEWLSLYDNNRYGSHDANVSKANTNGVMSKRVRQLDTEGNIVAEWPSIMEVEREEGYRASYISRCCNGFFDTAYGYRWEFIN